MQSFVRSERIITVTGPAGLERNKKMNALYALVALSEVGGSPGQAAPMPSPAGLSVTAATALAPGRLAR